MKEEKKEFKKWIILILVAVIAFWAINNLSTLGNILGKIVSIIFPFILGGSLAFILNIPMTFFERKLINISKSSKKKKIRKRKLLRIFAIIFAFAVIILILSLIINLIVPELISVITMLINNVPFYVEEITKFAQNHIEDTQQINSLLEQINIEEIKNQILGIIPNVLTSSISIVGGIVSGIVDFVIALIFSIYILMDKEKLKKQATRIIYAYFNRKRADKIINFGKTTSTIFKRFFTVQCLEATILGLLCLLGMLILRIPYAISISVLIGVTALIPVVGAFIGIIVGVILIIAVEPIKALVFIIFVLILQQIEGNIIYPRVVGSSVGLPGMWVLFAVTVGGSLAGIIGMLIGVPIATVIYTFLNEDVVEKLSKSKMS